MSIVINTKKITKEKLNRVVKQVMNSPFEKYDLQKLANIANISKYHFHRLFALFNGINIYEFLILVRLQNATKLLKNSDMAITDIAIDCGYSSSQSFAKSFKNFFCQSPSQFRKNPNLYKYNILNRKIKLVENLTMSDENIANVSIINFPQTNIAGIRHYGSPQKIHAIINKFIEWRIGQALNPHEFATFNIFHNPLSENEYDIEIGCEYRVTTSFAEDVIQTQIPAQWVASYKYIGDPDDIGLPATQLYKWAIDNNYEITDYPLFCKRVSFPPFVDVEKSETILYLPITNLR